MEASISLLKPNVYIGKEKMDFEKIDINETGLTFYFKDNINRVNWKEIIEIKV